MRYRFALLLLGLLAAAPSAAQVATVPVHSLWQAMTGDVILSTEVSIYGYTSKSPIPRVLRKQTVNLGTASLLQPQFQAQFPGLQDAEMTVMQLIVQSTANAPTFSSEAKTVTPKQPLAIKVPVGKTLWVVYTAPVGKQGELRFYVGSPPPTSVTSAASASAS